MRRDAVRDRDAMGRGRSLHNVVEQAHRTMGTGLLLAIATSVALREASSEHLGA
jgi:heme A synthase